MKGRKEGMKKGVSYIILLSGETLAILIDTWFVKLGKYCIEAYSVVGSLSLSFSGTDNGHAACNLW